MIVNKYPEGVKQQTRTFYVEISVNNSVTDFGILWRRTSFFTVLVSSSRVLLEPDYHCITVVAQIISKWNF